MPRLRPIAPNHIDVSAIFKTTASRLAPGQLAMLDTFALVNAIEALDIMDPKMDAGLLNMAEFAKPDELFVNTVVQTVPQFIWIVDMLFAAEMAWQAGATLTQSVFTSLFVEHAGRQFDGTLASIQFGDNKLLMYLRAYVLATMKSIDLPCRQMQCKQIIEDEDIVTQTHGFDLLQFIPVDRVLQDVRSALDALGSDSHPVNVRLQLKIVLLSIFAAEVEPASTSLLNSALELLALVEQTHTPADPVLSAFSTSIQGRLECAIPPRPELPLSFTKSVESCRQMLESLKSIDAVFTCSQPAQITQYLIDFALFRPLSRQDLPYVRTRLLKSIFVPPNRSSRAYLIADISKHVCVSPLLWQSESQDLKSFLVHADSCFQTLLSCLCQNKSRLRRSLCLAIIEWDALQVEVETLESSAEMLDYSPILISSDASMDDGDEDGLRALPLSSWVYLWKLQIMIWTVFLGFDLEIYKLEEWPVMMWYANYLIKVADSHLQRIENVLSLTDIYVRSSPSMHNQYLDLDGLPQTRTWLRFCRAELAVYTELCNGYICLFAALISLGFVRDFNAPQSKFSSPALLYSLRVKPFSTVGVPELPSYASFEEFTTFNNCAVDNLFANSETAFTMARRLSQAFEADYAKSLPTFPIQLLLQSNRFLDRCTSLSRSSVAGNIAILRLKALLGQNGSTTGPKSTLTADLVVVYESYHPFFPAITIKTK
ncbi:Mak10 subunit, NatC N-terminal acetyltransferase-domain-containing protein [Lipomyces oligophaga]|uniref:Mak10 subunit, NatC N-terminal acetyltransferase-domain-containing protein n=1 Tax=Lipomyces oligophaga TaxID=45792 RepID=UPI0034CD754C